jgi:hypothetical protein
MTVKERKRMWRKQISEMSREQLEKELRERKQFHVFLDMCSIELGKRMIQEANLKLLSDTEGLQDHPLHNPKPAGAN